MDVERDPKRKIAANAPDANPRPHKRAKPTNEPAAVARPALRRAASAATSAAADAMVMMASTRPAAGRAATAAANAGADALSATVRQRAATARRTRRARVSAAPTRTSARQQQAREARMAELGARMGSTGAEHSSNDLSALFGMALEPGADFRGYTSRPARGAINRQIEASRQVFPTLAAAGLPPAALVLREQAQQLGVGTARATTRGPSDQYRSGFDVTYTENTGLVPDTRRTAADTPRPRSPAPESTGEALSGTRYEHAHQDSFQLTRLPGHTVHASTQGNQVADTSHERFAASAVGGFTFRRDTYAATSMYSARPEQGGGWAVQQSSYPRRDVAASPLSPAIAATASVPVPVPVPVAARVAPIAVTPLPAATQLTPPTATAVASVAAPNTGTSSATAQGSHGIG